MENAISDMAVLQTSLPAYRLPFFDLLSEQLGDSFKVMCGDDYFGRKMTSGEALERPYVDFTPATYLAGNRISLQPRALRLIGWNGVVVVEGNARSVTTWMILVIRRLLGRQTYSWGHLRSRLGKRGLVRRALQTVANGNVFYTDEEAEAYSRATGRIAHVAPNALVRQAEVVPASSIPPEPVFIWSGRLVPEKKAELSIEALSNLIHGNRLPNARLKIVGDGVQRAELELLAEHRGIADSVDFLGAIYSTKILRDLYETVCASISTGYIGLSLVQSLGFGRPMLAPHDELHSPEASLSSTNGAVIWFDSDSVESLAEAMISASNMTDPRLPSTLQKIIEDRHNIDSMVAGFRHAVGHHK